MDSLSSIANDDFSSSLVQEISASLSDQQVPERYINKNGYTPAEEAITDLPIDFSRLSDEDELRKLRSALSTVGCFQIVNHGMDEEGLKKVMEVGKQFFALPQEEKNKCHMAAESFIGYGNDSALYPPGNKNWSDRLIFRVGSNDPADLRFWPKNPPEFSKSMRELGDKTKGMPETILKAITRSLHLQEDRFLQEHGSDGAFTVRLGFYPNCPIPDKVLGFIPHTDGATFSVLLQDREGLQVMANDRWLKVPVIPGALVIIVGDILEIMSNGAIKSTLHRVVADLEKERVSTVMFYNPSPFKEIGPVEKLVTTDRPKSYTKTTMIEFAKVHVALCRKGKPTLSAFKL